MRSWRRSRHAHGHADADPHAEADADADPAHARQQKAERQAGRRRRRLARLRGRAAASDYDPRKTLRVLIGRTTSGSHLAFFFVNGDYIGNDAQDPSAKLRVAKRGDLAVTLAYGIYAPGDARGQADGRPGARPLPLGRHAADPAGSAAGARAAHAGPPDRLMRTALARTDARRAARAAAVPAAVLGPGAVDHRRPRHVRRHAVRGAGGGRRGQATSASSAAAQPPRRSWCSRSSAGVWADRIDRRTIMITSDLVRLVCQALAGGLLIAGVAEPWHLAADRARLRHRRRVLRARDVRAAAADRLDRAPAVRQRPARADHVGGHGHRAGAGRRPGRRRRRRAARCWPTRARSRSASRSCCRLEPTTVERAEAERAGLPDRPARAAGGRCASRSWVWAMLVGLAVYHVVVLPSVFVLGPVLADRELGGAGGVGADHRRLRRRRPSLGQRPAAALAAVAAAVRQRRVPDRRVVPGVDHRQRAAGPGDRGAGGADRDLRAVLLHAVGDLDPGADPRARGVARRLATTCSCRRGLLPVGALVVGPIAEAAGLQRVAQADVADRDRRRRRRSSPSRRCGICGGLASAPP